MPRRLAEPYASPLLADLARQLLFAPPERKGEQAQQAEMLHDQVEEAQEYPYEFVAFRITGFRSEQPSSHLIAGHVLKHDLRLLIDALTRKAPIRQPEGAEPSLTPEELAAKLNVSTKTISRWRQLGLRWRWERRADHPRPVLVFTPKAVADFETRAGAKIARAAAFSRLTPAQRQALVQRARRLVQKSHLSIYPVARRLANQAGRSIESIRQLLEQHDRQHPEEAIFPGRTAPLSERQHRVIARAHRWGITIDKLAHRFGRTRSTIYRAIHDARAQALRQKPIPFIAIPTFSRDDADEVFLRHASVTLPPESSAERSEDSGVMPGMSDSAVLPGINSMPAPKGPELAPCLEELFQQAKMPRDRQRAMALRMNYLRYKAATLRDALSPSDPRVADLDRIDKFLRQADGIRTELVRANLPVLLTVARRHLLGHEDGLLRLPPLLEIGLDVLIDAVDRYDIRRNRSLEWYVTWRLMQQFVREQLKAETTLAEPKGGPLTRAARREDAAVVRQRMVVNAQQRGITLLP
ncbi:MAG: hypothetical protein IT441_02760 [Phycisphaeraceae bacterium]|nr:hypothetical protein [Phycisphaeraceae bacterium]